MSVLKFSKITPPPTPASGKTIMFVDTNGRAYTKDDAGVTHLLSQDVFGFTINLGDGYNIISAGYKGAIKVPYDFVLTKVELVGANTGTIAVDIWRDSPANFPPTDADSIVGSNQPLINTGILYADSSLSTWTVTGNSGDYLAFYVDTCLLFVNVALYLEGRKR
jgi:hypothetical protein